MRCSCVRVGGRGWLPCPFSVLSRPAAKAGPIATLYSTIPVVDCGLLLLAGNRLRRTLTGAGVGVRALTANRKAAPMTQSPIAAQIHQALDVHRDLTPEIALDHVITV